MTHSDRIKIWQDSLARLSAAASEAGIPPKGKQGSLVTARRFAESLLLCPSYESAVSCIRGEPDAAAAFIDVAFGVAEQVANPENQFEQIHPHAGGPFYCICFDTMDFLDVLQREFPDQYV